MKTFLPAKTRATQSSLRPMLCGLLALLSVVFAADPAALYRIAPKSLFLIASPRIGEDHRERALDVAKIVADVLAHCLFVRHIVDCIIDELEGNAEIAAISIERFFHILITFGEDGSNAAGGSK